MFTKAYHRLQLQPTTMTTSKISRCSDWFLFDRISIDTETTGLQYLVDVVFGISVSTPDNKDYYFDIRKTPQFVEEFNKFLKEFKGSLVFFNAQFDVKMLSGVGINVPLDKIEDSNIRAKLIDNTLNTVFPWGYSGGYSLDNLSKIYLNEHKDNSLFVKMAGLFGGKATRSVQIKNIANAPKDLVAIYAKKDSRLTLNLFDWQTKQIKIMKLEPICEFERKLIPVLIRMSMHGIKVATNKIDESIDKLDIIIEKEQKHLDNLLGFHINVNSPKQIREIFKIEKDRFGDFFVQSANGAIPIATTATGNPSLDSQSLLEIGTDISKLIYNLRVNKQASGTYLTKFVAERNIGGRIFPDFNQLLDTGRLSIKNPSMQNIPSRNKNTSQIIKSIFLPDDGQKWVDCDLASNEVRIFAHLVSKFNNGLIKEYQKNEMLDLHQYVADLTGLPRNKPVGGGANGKQLNLSSIFNQGRGETARQMGMDWKWESFVDSKGELIKYKKPSKEAEKVIEEYHQRIGGILELTNNTKKIAEQKGFIDTSEGRRLFFKRGWKTYKASGLLIQATAADINKRILLYIHNILKENQCGHLLLNIHDSYSMSLPPDKQQQIFKDIANEVRNPTSWSPTAVPLILEYSGSGDTWWDAIC